MKVVIIGAGLAGSVASGAFAGEHPVNYDASDIRPMPKHKAVMRLRDPTVARYLGVHVEPVTVWKAVSIEGFLYEMADIRTNNMYSLKLYGELGERSLKTLGRVDRWLLEGVPLPRETYWLHELTKVGDSDGKLYFNHGAQETVVEYDVCISTIPMEIMLRACGMDYLETFRAEPISVWTGTLKLESTLHQTIYFPGPDTPVYRATIQGKQVIIECINSQTPMLGDIMDSFGVKVDDFAKLPEESQQPMGKMQTINDDSRRQYIYELTERFNIYSFGRYAIWKPIRADHLVTDIEQIKALVKVVNRASGSYERSRARLS